MQTTRLILILILVGLITSPVFGIATAQEVKNPMPIAVSPYNEKPPENAQNVAEGKKIYERSCLYCHGRNGKGKGPAAFFLSRSYGPHPRDFTVGVFKFRSTVSGYLPTDSDLFHTITKGITGFMPSFGGLSPTARWMLVYYVKTFSPLFQYAQQRLIPVKGMPVPSTAGSIEKGYALYQELKCWECHGGGGRGDGTKAPEQKDDFGFRLPPQDLTRPEAFKNGSRPEDLYRTILGGLDGSPMPSYDAALKDKEEDTWHLINYILSLSSMDQ